jgi:hypothetical protein
MDRWEKRRKYFLENEKPKIEGKISKRVVLFLARCYMSGQLEGKLEQNEDKEFLRIHGLGPGTLKEIRTVVPSPK